MIDLTAEAGDDEKHGPEIVVDLAVGAGDDEKHGQEIVADDIVVVDYSKTSFVRINNHTVRLFYEGNHINSSVPYVWRIIKLAVNYAN